VGDNTNPINSFRANRPKENLKENRQV